MRLLCKTLSKMNKNIKSTSKFSPIYKYHSQKIQSLQLALLSPKMKLEKQTSCQLKFLPPITKVNIYVAIRKGNSLFHPDSNHIQVLFSVPQKASSKCWLIGSWKASSVFLMPCRLPFPLELNTLAYNVGFTVGSPVRHYWLNGGLAPTPSHCPTGTDLGWRS